MLAGSRISRTRAFMSRPGKRRSLINVAAVCSSPGNAIVRSNPERPFSFKAITYGARGERRLCPERRGFAAEVSGNPVALSDERQTGDFGRYHLDRRKTPSLTPIGDNREFPTGRGAQKLPCRSRPRFVIARKSGRSLKRTFLTGVLIPCDPQKSSGPAAASKPTGLTPKNCQPFELTNDDATAQ